MVISAVEGESSTVRVDAAAVTARASPVLVVVEKAVFCLVVVADVVAVSVSLVAVVVVQAARTTTQARSRINDVPFAVDMVATGCARSSCVVRVRFEVRERYTAVWEHYYGNEEQLALDPPGPFGVAEAAEQAGGSASRQFRYENYTVLTVPYSLVLTVVLYRGIVCTRSTVDIYRKLLCFAFCSPPGRYRVPGGSAALNTVYNVYTSYDSSSNDTPLP